MKRLERLQRTGKLDRLSIREQCMEAISSYSTWLGLNRLVRFTMRKVEKV
jgi:hypothetical protein